MIAKFVKVLQISRVGQGIQVDDGDIGLPFQQEPDKITPDESTTTGD
jgi:hypothetical protein